MFSLAGILNQGIAFNPNFVFTIDTTKAGVTGSSAFRIPMVSGSVYDFNVDWGDASNENVSGYALTAKDHTYSSPGIYTITISGTFPRIYFNNGGDKLKVLSTQNLGAVGWTSFYSSFQGCTNQTTVEGDVDWGTVTSLLAAWDGNKLTSWTLDLPASLTDCSYAWKSNHITSWTITLPTGLTSCVGAWYGNGLTSWTVDLPASLTNCSYAWWYNELASWTVDLPASVSNCNSAWRNNKLTSWTVDLPASLTNCSYAWYGNNITSWTGGGWAGVTNAANAVAGGTNNINTTDYNALLVEIEANNQNNNVPFHFGLSKHSGEGTIARAALIADHSDTFTDGGPA